jgi:hypothetical protein
MRLRAELGLQALTQLIELGLVVLPIRERQDNAVRDGGFVYRWIEIVPDHHLIDDLAGRLDSPAADFCSEVLTLKRAQGRLSALDLTVTVTAGGCAPPETGPRCCVCPAVPAQQSR